MNKAFEKDFRTLHTILGVIMDDTCTLEETADLTNGQHCRVAALQSALISARQITAELGDLKNTPFDFGTALTQLKHGFRVTREGWNGKGMWLEMQRPDKGSKMTLPYIYMKTVNGDLVPWVASQTDLLMCDWRLAGDPEA